MEWIGLDIGGANIKLATRGDQFSYPFALWKHPERLADFLHRTVANSKSVLAAVTMTGELADGYPNRQSGVHKIVEATEQVFSHVVYYQTTGKLVSAEEACAQWRLTAAANWHASASWFAQRWDLTSGFLIDIGSTTTDVVPIENRRPAGAAKTDLQRLAARQLVYTGIRRSPLCGIVKELELEGRTVSAANEFFATIEDAYVVLGKLPERNTTDTADGRELTKDNSAQRIARMVCTDVAEIGTEAIESIARQTVMAQRNQIAEAIRKVLAEFAHLEKEFILCGEGEWLAGEILSEMGMERVRLLSEVASAGVTECAAAVAVRELAVKAIDCAPSR